MTAVELAAVEDNALVVRGLDAIDGTLVLDVKPYSPRSIGWRRHESPNGSRA